MDGRMERLKNRIQTFWVAVETDDELSAEQKEIAIAAIRTILLMFDNEELWRD